MAIEFEKYLQIKKLLNDLNKKYHYLIENAFWTDFWSHLIE